MNTFGTGVPMSDAVIVSLIAAIPPTLAAIAALWQVRKLSRPLADVNRAVNHRTEGQRTLIQTIDVIAGDIVELRKEIGNVDNRVKRHLAFHQAELEDDAI